MNKENKSKELGIASITMAIVGLFVFGLPLGIGAAITGALGWKDSGLAKAGTILGGLEILVMGMYLI